MQRRTEPAVPAYAGLITYRFRQSQPDVISLNVFDGSGGTGGGTLPPPGSGNLPPTVSAGPDVSGTEGARLTLRGSASDPESNLSVTWTYTKGSDVDAGATCAFGDAHAASTTITCTDDATFFAALTADDGVNAPVRDTAG